MIDYDIIASRIKEARKYKKKISQKKMAEDLNMYQPDLSALENNKPGCGIRDLAKLEMIAGYLNISLGYLLFGELRISKEKEFVRELFFFVVVSVTTIFKAYGRTGEEYRNR